MMEKFLKNPLYKFLVWISVGVIVCLIGISNVNALETRTIYADSERTNSNKYIYGSNPNGSIGTASTGSNISGVSYGFSFWLNENVMLNKTYTLKINFMGDDLYNTFSSNMVNVSTCYSSTCNDNIILSIEKQSNSGRSTWLKINFNPISTGTYLYVGLSSTSTPLDAIAGPVAFGINSVQIESVNESQNIIDNQTANANNIINNQNQNTQDIMDNQNEIAENIIEQNKKNYEKCTDKAIIEYNKGKYFNNTGQLIDNSNTFYSDLIYVKGASILTISNVSGATYAYSKLILFDKNQMFVDWYELRNRTITLTDDIYYIAISSDIKTTQINYQNEVCINRLDEQTNAINGLNDTLTDSTAPTFDTSSISISPNTPISNILLLPINLLNAILTHINSTCSPISIPFLFNTNIEFPCFTISDYLGSTANIIDLCICFVMIYNILMLFVSVFEDITTLRDGFLSLYEPRHARGSYQPRHGKD